MPSIEQGPIRPPSESYSLLLRVTRNCPWNRCAFCHIYKGRRFSPRSVEEVKRDIDAIRQVVSEINASSWQMGLGGKVDSSLARSILSRSDQYPEGYRSIVLWLYTGAKNVFLQDADNLALKTKNLVEMLEYLKKAFPSIERITTYARAKTAFHKSVDEFCALRAAGLSRIHMGLESGHDPVLELVQKGVTAHELVESGRKIKKSGISLSEYIMPGLGGKSMWREHAVETARVLNQIDPDFIRVRTLKVLNIMPLYQKIQNGEFELRSDDEMVEEEKLLIENLNGIHSQFTSDHILNLLQEVEGRFPEDKERMLAVIDRYQSLDAAERQHYRLGRRTGFYQSLDDMYNPDLRIRVDQVMRRIQEENAGKFEQIISDIMETFI